MNAYCEHLGAHLGFGGRVVGEAIQCPFHGWQWNSEGATSASRTRAGRNCGRRMTMYPVTERNESIYIWHDVEGRAPFFEAPDVLQRPSTTRSSVADDHPEQRLFEQAHDELRPARARERRRLLRTSSTWHENADQSDLHPARFRRLISYVYFTITFEVIYWQKIDDVAAASRPSTVVSASR